MRLYMPVSDLSICRISIVSILLTCCLSVKAGDLFREWGHYGGDPGSTQYSSLTQINLSNIKELTKVWEYHTGEVSYGDDQSDATLSEATPIFQNNLLYSCTPYNRVAAIHPATGKEVWSYDPHIERTGTYSGAHYCRGVSFWSGDKTTPSSEVCQKRILSGLGDGQLIALDADNGTPCRDFGKNGRVNLNNLDLKGEGSIALTSPPTVYQDLVIVGSTIHDNKWGDTPDGIVRAFNVLSGELVWEWNPIPDHLSNMLGGANVWTTMSVDLQRGWVFLPTGSPSHDLYGGARKEQLEHANAVVVLDAKTGEKIWSYQIVHHDLWDYDLPSAPTLTTVIRSNKEVPAVVQATKMGFLFVLDRETGRPLFPVHEQPVPQSDVPGEYTAPTQPIPELPKPFVPNNLNSANAWGMAYVDKNDCKRQLASLRNEGLYTPPSLQGSILYPSSIGGSNWGGVAIDPLTRTAVINASNMAFYVRLIKRENYDPKRDRPSGSAFYEMAGSPYLAVRGLIESFFGAPCSPTPWGLLTAIDLDTGETLWQIPFGQNKIWGPFTTPTSWGSPNQGGPIITKGGIIFIGASLDNTFRAYNPKNGKMIWQASIPAPATATPMTYEYEGRQYVVVSAGGHARLKTELSDALIAFALPRSGIITE